MRVTDVIGNEYKEWKQGDMVSIASGTGSGKSYFVQNVLAKYAKEKGELILYLVPRRKLKEQIEAALEQEGITNITVKMYHSVEQACKQLGKDSDWLNAYNYIVCDESHYFLNDASFNSYTDMSLEHILSVTHAVNLFLSATGEALIRYLKYFHRERQLFEYTLEKDYSYVKPLSAYQSDETLYKKMDWLLKNNHKAMIFIQSDRKAYELFKNYAEHSTFVCGVNSDYVKYVEQEKVNTIIQQERFDTLFLIATSALDVGVNVIDTEVKHIIIDMLDTDTFIQCLGRKRLSSIVEEQVSVMFKAYSNQQLGGHISKESKKVEQGKVYYQKIPAITNRYAPLSDIFYMNGSGEIKVNKMKYMKAAVNLARYKKYTQQENGYLKEIKSLLNYQGQVYIQDNLQDTRTIQAKLKEYLNHKFSVAEAKLFIQELSLKNSKTKKSVKSIEVANREFVALGYPYEFVQSKEYVLDAEGEKKQQRFYTLKPMRQNSL